MQCDWDLGDILEAAHMNDQAFMLGVSHKVRKKCLYGTPDFAKNETLHIWLSNIRLHQK